MNDIIHDNMNRFAYWLEIIREEYSKLTINSDYDSVIASYALLKSWLSCLSEGLQSFNTLSCTKSCLDYVKYMYNQVALYQNRVNQFIADHHYASEWRIEL